jgi:Predicted transcriptional regulator
MNKNQETILLNIKLKGPMSIAQLAQLSGITNEGMRQHLEKLEKEGYVTSTSSVKGVGRPTTLFHLGKKGEVQFPDTHARLAVQLLDSIRDILGNEALMQIIEVKQKNDYSRYKEALKDQDTIREKLENLTRIRTEEGYMAEWEESEGCYFFTENNCPICSAAKSCGGFCKAEIENIQKLLGEKIQVERTSHTASGDLKCSYFIKEK